MKYPNGFYQMDSRIFDRGLKPIVDIASKRPLARRNKAIVTEF